MKFIEYSRFFGLSNTKSKKKKILALFLLSLFLVNAFFLNSHYSNLNHQSSQINFESPDKELVLPIKKSQISLFTDPFYEIHYNLTRGIAKIFLSDLNPGISLLHRFADEEGNITNVRVYSRDNLELYLSLEKRELSAIRILGQYKALKETDLFYNNSNSKYDYGFIESINGSDGEIINDKRNLIDNLLPIDLLIKNNAHKLGETSVFNNIESMFALINSSVFWDNISLGFKHDNTTTSYKSVEDNLYTILTNLLINKTEEIAPNIRNRAYQLANLTMNTLMDKMWNELEIGFYYTGDLDWSTSLSQRYKYLETNALGIISLLEFWLATGKNKTTYFNNATALYQKINDYLWNSTYNAYEYRRSSDWENPTSSPSIDGKLELSSNAMMMRACLKFFELTGDIQYYQRALKIYNFLENHLYNETLNVYTNSIGFTNDTNINFLSNLKLFEAYLDASSIYNSTSLIVQSNLTEIVPELIIDQHTLNLTSLYKFQKTLKYYNPKTKTLETHETIYNITGADINFIFRYPNNTILKEKSASGTIKANVTEGHIGEKSKIVCLADQNNNLNNTFFNISTPSTDYIVWLNLNNSNEVKPIFPGKTVINISSIRTNDDNETVARKISNTLGSYDDGNVFENATSQWNITITNIELGNATDISDGPPSNATNFLFETLIQGKNKTVSTYTQLFAITEDIPLSRSFEEYNTNNSPFSITVYVNTTWFRFAKEYSYFHVISGLENQSIKGLEDIDFLYQGQTVNISLPIESIRNNNLTLNSSLSGDFFYLQTKDNINFTSGEITPIEFNLTAKEDAEEGIHSFQIDLKKDNIIYLSVIRYIEIEKALEYKDLMYNKKVVIGDEIDISLKLINILPNNSQNFNLSFSSDYIDDYLEEISLNKDESRTKFLSLNTNSEIVEDSISIEMIISKGKNPIYSETITVSIAPILEINSINIPETVNQGDNAYLIIYINNNKRDAQEFTLSLNGEEIEVNKKQLGPGENRIEYQFIATLNPYDFQTKDYKITLEDGSDCVIAKESFKIQITLSMMNFILFYVFPAVIPVAIVLFYKNKDLKYKLLKR